MVEVMYAYVDLETRSRADLKTVGGRVYAEQCELLCGVAAVDEGDCLRVYSWGMVDPGPPEGWAVSADKLSALGFGAGDVVYEPWAPGPPDLTGCVLVGWNSAGFDEHVWRNLGYPPARWEDAMERARRAALPGRLDECGATVLGVGKDTGGAQTLKLLMRPHKKTGKFLTPDGPHMRTLLRYNVQDVLLMAAICDEENLLAPHIDDPVLAVHREINERGIYVDRDLARVLLTAQQELEARQYNAAAQALGCTADEAGAVIRSPTALRPTLAGLGYRVADTQAETLKALDADGAAAVLIEARLNCATVTKGKVLALLARTQSDDRYRGSLQYCGAHTGRWAGRGFQLQNLPRPPKGWEPEHVERVKAEGYAGAASIAAELGCDVGTVLGACLRGLLCAPPGRHLAQVDLDQIEARVLHWLAENEDGLTVFRQGGDPYTAQAERMGPGVSRQIGKVAVLACGYQGAVGAFHGMAKNYGATFSDEEASRAVEAFRDANPALAGRRNGGKFTKELENGVVREFICRTGGFWKAVGKAAELATASIGGVAQYRRANPVKVGRLAFFVEGPDLFMLLPSGRTLRYRNAKVETDPNKWGEGQPGDVLRFDGVHDKGGRVVRMSTYGGKLVENATQAVARDVMVHAVVALRGEDIVGSVHDELLVEVDDETGLRRVEAAMVTVPDWAPGLPLGAAGELRRRYAK